MAPSSNFPVISVNKRASARLEKGHLWIFSNEVTSEEGTVEDGGEVSVLSDQRRPLGTAVYNKKALIRARLFSRESIAFDADLVRERIEKACNRRHRYYGDASTYRLVYTETDGLPGLLIDRYGSYFIVDFSTVAIRRHRETVFETLKNIYDVHGIVERTDSLAAKQEGIDGIHEAAFGEIPDSVEAHIDGISFGVNLLSTDQPVFPLDHAENWRLMDRFAPGRKVLDLFCNQGGFSLRAARVGASSVRAIDSNATALSKVLFNSERNGITSIRAKDSDPFQYVRSLPEEFDLIICNPPILAKSRKQVDTALRQYRELNRNALKMLNPGGVLITTSCSPAISEADFQKMLSLAAKDGKIQLRVLPGGGQPIDHAPLSSMAETRYLKVRTVEVVH